ncbi:MAG TPA: TolC family protein [Candidatus Xenobia bacterium]
MHVRWLLLGLILAVPASADPLSLRAAVEQAVAHNPSLLASQAQVAEAEAEVRQAGLVANPELGAQLRFPNERGFVNQSDYSLTFDFLSLGLRPPRQRQAWVRLEQARARAGQSVVDLQCQVRQAWYTLAAAQEVAALQQTVATASQGAADLAERQYAAGNINELDLQRQRAASGQDQLDLERDSGDVREAQQHLAVLMGGGEEATAGPLPDVPVGEPDAPVAQADQRGDVVAARLEAQALSESRTVARREAGWGQIRGGISAGQEVEGVGLLGPTLQWTLPLFNQNQGEVARIDAEMGASQRQADAASQQARHEVQTAWTQLHVAHRLVDMYRTELVPSREKIVEHGQLYYNNMQLNVYQLLADRQALAQARQQAILARRDYWMAAAALDRAAGKVYRNE